MSALSSRTKDSPKADLGTFGGVFTPSVLTILGIILFLRLGYVVVSYWIQGGSGLTTAVRILEGEGLEKYNCPQLARKSYPESVGVKPSGEKEKDKDKQGREEGD